MKRAALVFLSAVSLASATGCSSRQYYDRYVAGVNANREHVQSLRIGMTRAEVEAAMGSGHIVDRRKIQLRNPYRVEMMRVSEAKTVEVLYYVTEGHVWENPETQTLTPLIFENGKLAGWGWAFLQRDQPKYVSGPAAASPPNGESRK
jgi:hypothetical protein